MSITQHQRQLVQTLRANLYNVLARSIEGNQPKLGQLHLTLEVVRMSNNSAPDMENFDDVVARHVNLHSLKAHRHTVKRVVEEGHMSLPDALRATLEFMQSGEDLDRASDIFESSIPLEPLTQDEQQQLAQEMRRGIETIPLVPEKAKAWLLILYNLARMCPADVHVGEFSPNMRRAFYHQLLDLVIPFKIAATDGIMSWEDAATQAHDAIANYGLMDKAA